MSEVRVVKKNGKRATTPAAPPAGAAEVRLWEDRWVKREREDPTQLLGNDLNWRGHPKYQQMAMLGLLETLGWLDTIKVNINTGRVFDGHMRCEIAISEGVTSVPVDFYNLTEEQERLALATFNPIAQLAFVSSPENLSALADFAESSGASAGLKALAAHTAGRKNIQAAFATDFLAPFLNPNPTGGPLAGAAPEGADARPGFEEGRGATGDVGAAPGGDAPAGAGGAAVATPQVTVVDPQHAASPEFLKVVFNFLPHQKKALFKLLNEQQVARGMQANTHAEVLLTTLGVSLTDETV
ncbi:MAG TPA: hypothetical protein VF668_01245 [Pyrinomonadaceae bacterium]|jgi:hypothetical protein